MGTDIHFYVERQGNGVWQSADKWTPNKYGNEEGEPPVAIDYKNRFYSGRNFDLFGILADVRNGRGFAGIDTGEGFVPIDDPRGMPDDVSELVKAETNRSGSDDHSHSWLTVSELLAYDWTRTTKHRGFLNAAEYWRWNRWDRERGESPKSWCGKVDGGAIRKVDEEQMKALIEPFGLDWSAEDNIKLELAGVYCRCEWETPYYKSVRDFWSNTIPQLLSLGKPEDVRIVFFFDN